MVAWRQLPCDIVVAGSGLRKVKVAAKKRKKVTINRRCGSMSGGAAQTAMRHRRGRQRAAQSESGGKKRINQRCGSVSGGVEQTAVRHLRCSQRAAQSESGGEKRKKAIINRSCGSMSGGVAQIIVAGSGLCKVKVAA